MSDLVSISSGRSRSVIIRLCVRCCADRAEVFATPVRLHPMPPFLAPNYTPNTPFTSVRQLDDGVNARRARIGVLGTFMGDWNYALVIGRLRRHRPWIASGRRKVRN